MTARVWKQRFQSKRKLADTLQGHIYLAVDLGNNSEKVVIKETYKKLVESGKSRDGHVVHEDFINESRILTYLSRQTDRDDGFCRIIYEWQTEDCYYYAMQFCEAELFKFISNSFAQHGKMYKYMKKETSKPQVPCESNGAHEWLVQIRSIFRQCVQCVYWMHKKGICHLDLSLENTMIYKVEGLKVKIIDFGLAKHYDYENNEKDKNFLNDKRVGKRGYMAPEVYNKMIYDARRADVWSLGVMLFMMLVGAPPYKRATQRDAAFNYIINGMLEDVLKHWRRLRLISKDALDCMEKIFKWEKDRITMEQLICHPFIGLSHLLNNDKVDGKNIKSSNNNINNSYIRILTAVKEYHNRYVEKMQAQYDRDGGRILNNKNDSESADKKNKNKNDEPQQLISFKTEINPTEKIRIPQFGQECKEILTYGNVRLLDDFNLILTHHSKLNAITTNDILSNDIDINNIKDEILNDKSQQSLAQLYDSLLDSIKNQQFIGVDNSIIIKRCFRNRLKCEDERALLEVYGKYNKNVINDDEQRMAMQIMDKIYFYFAYTYNFGFTFMNDEIKKLIDDDNNNNDESYENDEEKSDQQLDKILFKIKSLLFRKKKELLKTSHGKQIYNVIKDRKTKYCTSSNNCYNDNDDNKETNNENNSDKQPSIDKESEQKQQQQQQRVPGPSIKIFRNIKNRMQQFLIQMQNAPQTMNHREFIKFLKTLQIRSKKEDKLSSLKGIPSDSWKAMIGKFEGAQMSEAYFSGLTKKQFGTTLRKVLQTGYIVKLHKVIREELQELARKRFFTEKTRVEKCDGKEIFQLLWTVLKDTDKMDIENDLDLTKLRTLFTSNNITGEKFCNLDEEYIINNFIVPCLLKRYDNIDGHRFGKRFRYWPAYSDNKTNDLLNGFYYHHWYVRPKYNDIKDEILNNTICSITVNQWNRTVLYASKIIIRTIAIKKLKASVIPNKKDGGSTSNSSYNKYGVKNNDRIRLEHLVPLLIYINLDFVSKKLLTTYNNNNYINNDYGTWIKYMKYHSQLSHLARLVRETVECYGNNNIEPKTFYHIIDKSICPSSLNTRFFSPTSVTTSINAAFVLNDFNSNQVIYQLNCYPNSNLTYFNCSWLSDYPNEYEHIICGGLGCQIINNIYDLYNSINNKYYINAIKMLIDTINAKQITNYDDNTLQKIGISLNSLMQTRFNKINNDDANDSNNKTLSYIDGIFEEICKNIRYAQINANSVINKSPLMKAVLCNAKNNSIRFDVLSTIFPNINRYLVYLNEIENQIQQKIIFNNNIIKFLKTINDKNSKRRSLKIQSIKYNSVDPNIESSEQFKTYQPKFAQIGWKLNCFTFDNITTLSIEYTPNLKNEE